MTFFFFSSRKVWDWANVSLLFLERKTNNQFPDLFNICKVSGISRGGLNSLANHSHLPVSLAQQGFETSPPGFHSVLHPRHHTACLKMCRVAVFGFLCILFRLLFFLKKDLSPAHPKPHDHQRQVLLITNLVILIWGVGVPLQGPFLFPHNR